MKKLFFLLFIACAIMACSKDDNIITPQPEPEEPTVEVKTFPTGEFVAIEEMTNTFWQEYSLRDILYSADGKKIEEYYTSIDGGDYLIGHGRLHLYIGEQSLGFWKSTLSAMGPSQPWHYGEGPISYNLEEHTIKIDNTTYSLNNFSPEYIELVSRTTSDDGSYRIMATGLIPQESDITWDEWVAKFKAENGE